MTTSSDTIVTKTKSKPTSTSKKKIRKDLEQKLATALAEYKDLVSEKKFNRAIAKVGKQLADRFARHKAIAKKPTKNTTPKAKAKTKTPKARKTQKQPADA